METFFFKYLIKTKSLDFSMETGIALCNRDRGPQTGRAAADQQYVVGCSRAIIHHETPRPPESYRRASLPVHAAVVELYTRQMPQPQA